MKINVRPGDGVIIVKPDGNIIGPASREFRDLIAEQLTCFSHPPKLLFDFSDVPLMDSTALGVLMGTHQTIAPESGRLAVINLNSKIKRLMARSKVTAVLEQFDSEDEAIAALTSP